MRTWNAIIAGLCMAALPSIAVAQGIAKNLDELRLLVRVGESVAVTDASRTEVSGKILSLSTSVLTLEVAGRPRAFKEAEITRITQRRGDSLGNGALWGLGAGAGLVALTIATSGHGPDGWATVALLVYGGIGTGIGVGVDAMVTRREVIFERPAGSTTFDLIPLLTGGRKGAVLRITF
jgi:hypothetical protein